MVHWMCYVLKYGVWNVAQPKAEDVNRLARNGYAPLAAMVLAARGIGDEKQAGRYLDCNGDFCDPFSMLDMDLAAARLALAMERSEKIAVFGDYDVDGITATCLLTEFIRRHGGDCVPYIPGRLEEGYGLNAIALRKLCEDGVKLIVTVDCGITAVEEAQLCQELGMDLIITDHHECKEVLPRAVAVVDPHRPGDRYPHKSLSGVGVAFKLAAALSGNQEELLEECADLVCLGTVADVMVLQGENRRFVAKGLSALRNRKRPGIRALMQACGCDPTAVNAASVGYVLAPRINAAGRMGQIELAVELFLTEEETRAAELAEALCELNRQRQTVEAEIYRQAVEMLPEEAPDAIVLAEERWHQGVVGIVASRMAEEYCCPTFLICLDADHGKGSSRSFGGFNLFSALSRLSPLLENYGGHEMAAGFTIDKSRIADFRREICALARTYYTQDTPRTALEADCAVSPELLTLANVDSLEKLEPCGNGWPKPVLVMERLEIEKISQVGNGRHMRLRLRQGRYGINAIYFSATPQTTFISQGDWVDVAFVPQVNEYHGERTVQMNIMDIRPSCAAECEENTAGYRALREDKLNKAIAEELLPDRGTLSTVWRYLASAPTEVIQEPDICLCRKIVRWSNLPLGMGQFLTCLDIFSDVGLLEVRRQHKYITLHRLPWENKADLTQSQTMQRLLAAKES